MQAELPPWSRPLFDRHRYKSMRGGRGGGKSWAVATVLLVEAARLPLRVLCARELQNSIKDSVHRLLADRVSTLGLPYEVTEREIRHQNGSLFLFEGVKHNIDKIKSMEGIDRCWVEEAQNVSEDSWHVLIPTIRKSNSEIWLTWNPDQEEDPTYRRFVLHPPPDCWSVKVGWESNPWFSAELRAEKDYLYAVDPEAAAHVWGGECRRNSDSQVLRGRYRVEAFDPAQHWFGPYYGADWGFATDPTTLIRCWIDGRTLYVEHEAYKVGCDIEDTPALFKQVPGSSDHVIRADNSRPETISHMRRHGFFRMTGAVKGAASVEDGVEHLRSYERIVIHPRCTHTAEEARLWSYKVDRLTGDVLPVLKPGSDHCMDAIRYALEPVIRAGKPQRVLSVKPKRGRHDYDREEPVTERWKVV